MRHRVNNETGFEEKWCPECEDWEPAFRQQIGDVVRGFYKSKSSDDGLQTHCICCMKGRKAGVGRAKYVVKIGEVVRTFRSKSKACVYIWKTRVQMRESSSAGYADACKAKVEKLNYEF